MRAEIESRSLIHSRLWESPQLRDPKFLMSLLGRCGPPSSASIEGNSPPISSRASPPISSIRFSPGSASVTQLWSDTSSVAGVSCFTLVPCWRPCKACGWGSWDSKVEVVDLYLRQYSTRTARSITAAALPKPTPKPIANR